MADYLIKIQAESGKIEEILVEMEKADATTYECCHRLANVGILTSQKKEKDTENTLQRTEKQCEELLCVKCLNPEKISVKALQEKLTSIADKYAALVGGQIDAEMSGESMVKLESINEGIKMMNQLSAAIWRLGDCDKESFQTPTSNSDNLPLA